MSEQAVAAQTAAQTIRLERMEEKLDQIQVALVTLARVEEKIADLELRRQEQREEFLMSAKQIDLLDRKVTKIGEKTDIIGKVVWLVVAAVVSAIGAQLSQIL